MKSLNQKNRWIEQLLYNSEEGGAGGGDAGPEPKVPTNVVAERKEMPSLSDALNDLPSKDMHKEETNPVSTSETQVGAEVAEPEKPAEVKVPEVPKVEAPAVAPTPALTADDLRSVMEKMPEKILEMQKAAQAQQPKADAQKPQFKPWRPGPELIEKVLQGGETAVEAIGEISDNATLQAINMIAPYFEQKLAAVQEHLVFQAKEAAKAKFVQKYPHYEPFVGAAEEYANKLLATGKQYTQEQLFEEVAKGLEPIVQDYQSRVEKYQAAKNPKPAGGNVKPPTLPGGKPKAPGANGSGKEQMSDDERLMRELDRRAGRA